MKKVLYIIGVFAFLLVFASCEKCDKPAVTSDPFATESNAVNRGGKEDDEVGGNRPNTFGGITDPDEDEDFDGIVDPEEDEDFDEDSDGK